MGAKLETRVISEMLVALRQNTCLWDHNDPQYMNKDVKSEAYETLLKIYLKAQPDANLALLKKKLENLRTSYKRERKKVQASKNRPGEVFTSKLWYYDLLTFLDGDQPDMLATSDYKFLSDEEECEEEFIDTKPCEITTITCEKKNTSAREAAQCVFFSDSEVISEEEIYDTSSRKRKGNRGSCSNEKKNKPTLDATEYMAVNMNTAHDEFGMLGQVLANKLRTVAKFDYQQYLHADHLINDIVYRALQGELTRTSTVVNLVQSTTSGHR